MPDVPKLLGRVQPPANIAEASATTLYTVPATMQAALDLHIASMHTDLGVSGLKLLAVKAGDAYSSKQILTWFLPFPSSPVQLRIPGLALAAGDAIKVATSNNKFAINAFGFEGEAAGAKILAQYQIATTAWTDVYTCPVDKRATVSLLNVCNIGPSYPMVNLAIVPSGESIASQHVLWWDAILHQYGTFQERNIVLGPGDKIRMVSTVTGPVVNVFGFEVAA